MICNYRYNKIFDYLCKQYIRIFSSLLLLNFFLAPSFILFVFSFSFFPTLLLQSRNSRIANKIMKADIYGTGENEEWSTLEVGGETRSYQRKELSLVARCGPFPGETVIGSKTRSYPKRNCHLFHLSHHLLQSLLLTACIFLHRFQKIGRHCKHKNSGIVT